MEENGEKKEETSEKDFLQVFQYRILKGEEGVEKRFSVYKASWCVSCKKIATLLEDFEERHLIKKESETTVRAKDALKRFPGVKIPFFCLLQGPSNDVVKVLQTSKKEEIEVLLEFDTISYDDDF